MDICRPQPQAQSHCCSQQSSTRTLRRCFGVSCSCPSIWEGFGNAGRSDKGNYLLREPFLSDLYVLRIQFHADTLATVCARYESSCAAPEEWIEYGSPWWTACQDARLYQIFREGSEVGFGEGLGCDGPNGALISRQGIKRVFPPAWRSAEP